MMAPVMEKLSVQYGENVVKVVNVDLDQATAQEYQIQSIPTFVFIKNGVEVERKSGMMATQNLIAKIEELLE